MKKNKGSSSNKDVSSSDTAGQSSFVAGNNIAENPDQSLHSVFFTPPTSPLGKSDLSSQIF